MENKSPDITVQYVDEIRCRIVARKEILYNLKEIYSFYADGYKFHPLYKQGKWSGKISLIDGKGLFYNGLLKDLLRNCKEKGMTIKVQDISRYMPTKISDDVINHLATYIKFDPYDYQLRSVKESLEKRKLLVLSPTSSGKSAILYMLYRYCVDNNMPMLITVPSTSLVEQLYSDFESYVSDGHIVEDHVAKLYGGQDKETDKLVIISTWQTAITMDSSWFDRFQFYACDECHQASAKSISSIIDNLKNCRHRIGLTGTLNGAEMHEIEMQARFGDIFKMVTTRELIDRGIVTDIGINCMKLTREPSVVDHFHKYCKNEYQKEIDFIINSEERNKFLTDLALDLKTNTLMLFNRIDAHGMKLLDILEKQSIKNKKKVFYISGSVKTKDREVIRKMMDSELPLFYEVYFDNGAIVTIDSEFYDEKEITKYMHKELNVGDFKDHIYINGNIEGAKVIKYSILEGAYILIATYGTLAVGISIKRLHNLIFCHPYKGKILTLQSIGRILRKSEVKNKVYLFDIIDDFRKGKKVNHAYKHAIKRLEIYEEEEFEYDIIEKRI